MRRKKFKELNKFEKSNLYFLVFYLVLLIIWLLLSLFLETNLLTSLFLIWLGNLIIVFITQLIHFYNKAEDIFFRDFRNCVIRCSAGILEMVLYVIFFAIGLWEVIVGYLIMKTLSVWKPGDTSMEGVATAGLRIAVVLSLIFALIASQYFLNYLQYKGFNPEHKIFIHDR